MNYSDSNSSVRVDFFRESGKWYTTEAVIWTGKYEGSLIHDAFLESLKKHFEKENIRSRALTSGSASTNRLEGMWAVCLEPYHEHSHPIMVRVPRFA